jgi:hypothetical protein
VQVHDDVHGRAGRHGSPAQHEIRARAHAGREVRELLDHELPGIDAPDAVGTRVGLAVVEHG